MPKEANEATVYSRSVGFKYRAEYDANNYIVYEGWAYPGAANSSAKWQILKHTRDANNNLTQTDWASKNDKFDKVWNDRATYTYG